MKNGKTRLLLLRSERDVPARVEDLAALALVTGDLHAAAAVYEAASPKLRERLAAMMFSQRRNALMLARWEHTPPSVLARLTGYSDTAIRLRLDKHAGTPSQALADLYRDEKQIALIRLIAQHRQAPSDLLTRLAATSDDDEVLKAVAGNPAAGGDALESISRRMPKAFDSDMAANAAAPAKVLEAIYRRGNAYLRAAVAGHPHCPASVIALATDETEPVVLRQAARDGRIGEAAINRLAVHPDAGVRRGIAGNAATPGDVIEQLARDEAAVVRRCIAAREDLAPPLMQCLANDADHWVRQWLARNPATPDGLLQALARDEEAEVRRAVGRNARCPELLLMQLAEDNDPWVRAAVAYHANAKPALLNKLAEDDSVDVLSGVASNPNTPQTVLRTLARHPEDDVRRGVILNRKAGRNTLLPLLQDPYYLHRMLLIGNAALHADDKWGLHDDPDPTVRFAVFKWFADRCE
jgi:hypothetical protein